jgi:regulator of cell morphogenesis and NO signaling
MTQDPIQRLLQEHVALMVRFEPLRRAVRDWSLGEPVDAAAFLSVLRDAAQVMTTDLIAHAKREDDVFFPAVEAAMDAAYGSSAGPTTVMRDEHVRIHTGARQFQATLRELQDVQHPAIVEGGARLRALASGEADARELAGIAGDLLDLIDDHFAKEEQVLFPMSRELLDGTKLREVAEQMERLEVH